jgi:hypothetical protein
LNIPRGTVSDVVVRFKRRGSVKNKLHTGRLRLLDERDTRVLARLVRSDSKTPLKADDRFISGLILKIEGLKMHCRVNHANARELLKDILPS